MPKDYVKIKDDEIIGSVVGVDLDPAYEAIELAAGYEYREVTGETKESIQELTLVGGSVVRDKGRKNAKTRERRKKQYPSTEEMVIALLMDDQAALTRLKKQVTDADTAEPLDP